MSDRKYVPMDDVFEGVNRTVKLLNYMLGERSQLYATIIYLMETLGQSKIVMPTIEGIKEYQNTFVVSYVEEDGEFVLKITERDEPLSPEVLDDGE